MEKLVIIFQVPFLLRAFANACLCVRIKHRQRAIGKKQITSRINGNTKRLERPTFEISAAKAEEILGRGANPREVNPKILSCLLNFKAGRKRLRNCTESHLPVRFYIHKSGIPLAPR